ncbi:MAG TPA: hypothetical protein VJ438_02110 [Candidatus Nanoarchaeia archaeon]|nr:hypothetical protein [Candidatus Nanoarchaeia archaeon]
MSEGHYYEHIIYNRRFYEIMEEFKRLILNDENLKKYSTHQNQRFSLTMRLFVMNYVLKHSTSQELKDYVTKLKEAITLGN